jgi:hypothetical protein
MFATAYTPPLVVFGVCAPTSLQPSSRHQDQP